MEFHSGCVWFVESFDLELSGRRISGERHGIGLWESDMMSMANLEKEVKVYFTQGYDQKLAFWFGVRGQMHRLSSDEQLQELKYSSRDDRCVNLFVIVVSHSNKTQASNTDMSEEASNPPVSNAPSSPAPPDAPADAEVPSRPVLPVVEKTPSTCPSSFPLAPPDDYWPDAEDPGQFASDNDEPIGIKEEVRYNKIFDIVL